VRVNIGINYGAFKEAGGTGGGGGPRRWQNWPAALDLSDSSCLNEGTSKLALCNLRVAPVQRCDFGVSRDAPLPVHPREQRSLSPIVKSRVIRRWGDAI